MSLALSVNAKPMNTSSHMDKYEQYHSSQSPNRHDISGSVLRSLLSTAPRAAPARAPASLPGPCLLETDQEWAHVTQVPFDAHCRIKWTWTKSAEELNVVTDQQYGTRAVLFGPACFETFAAMGDRPLRKNALTYWQVAVSSQTLRNATSVMVGVGTKQAKKRSIGYLNLIGADQHSWGLSNRGQLWHNNQIGADHCEPLGSGEQQQDQVVIGLLYDGRSGQLSFYVNGTRAAAFEGVGQQQQQPLYPMISSTASNSRFEMGPVHESVPTLQDLCRDTITTSLSPSAWNQQALPQSIIDFLN